MKTEDLRLWRAFVCVAQQGGFSKAADLLREPVPQVSKRVARLEDTLGTRLFHRSTRVVRLTDEGAALLPKIASVLEDLTELESTFENASDLSGTVKVTSVPYVARRLLVPSLGEFMRHHPKIKLELQLTKDFVNLIEEGFDVAIRIDTPSDNELIYRKLAPNSLVACASPQYLLRSKAAIRMAPDLERHALLFLSVHGDCRFLKSSIPLRAFSHRKVIECDSGTLLTDMAIQGHGILVRAMWDVQHHLKSGVLVPLLKNDPLEPFGEIHAVIPNRRFLAPRVRAFFDFVVTESSRWKLNRMTRVSKMPRLS